MYGNNVFVEYWNRPQATLDTFVTINGINWFKTGDVVVVDEHGRYWIKGRQSADIIKSSGYKISSLDVEQVLLQHPLVSEVAVFGVTDEVYGERVVAMIVPKKSVSYGVEEEKKLKDELEVKRLREWGDNLIARYKLPTVVKLVDELPRNAMGKINKKMLSKEFKNPTSVV